MDTNHYKEGTFAGTWMTTDSWGKEASSMFFVGNNGGDAVTISMVIG